MPVRVFSEEEKNVIKEKLLRVGFPLLKEFGVIHMSVPKITKAADIGTGTFYRFFESKEDYLYQLIQYRRKQMLQEFIPTDVLKGERKLTQMEVRHFIELIADRDNSVYANMSLQDEAELLQYIGNAPNLAKEEQVSSNLLEWADISAKKIDFALVANMMKVLAITAEAREALHPSGYDKTIQLLIDQIMLLLYGKVE